MSAGHKIAEAAAAIGVTPGTLRLWEQHGLLAPKRLPSGHRVYDEAEMERARRIAHLRTREGLGLYAIGAAIAPERPHAKARQTRAVHNASLATLGQRVRRMRSARKVGLKAFADALEVSPSVVSTFERTSQGISVALLRRIADYFCVTVTQLTLDPTKEDGDGVVQRTQGRRITTLGAGIETRALATGFKVMDCKEWTLEPGAKSDGAYSHEGEEFVYVLSGNFEITVEDLGSSSLGAGDSLYFESTRRHSWNNPGPDPCVLLWINTPPSF
jgi:DNA-binding transcriptional MerR regulator/quercetin dioxygenase-like cupin family protein